MQAFEYKKSSSLDEAVGLASPQSKFIAGGTTLVDLMKLNVERPTGLVDINPLPLDRVETTSEGGLKIGALVRNSDLAHHPEVNQQYAVLSEALLSGASPQLRNMATTGGNLLQRTRCFYFRDPNYACNKRNPGAGCAALEGFNRIHAILGTSEHCIATHPSDMDVALTALEVQIHIRGLKGERTVPIHDFYLLPGDTPQHENVLTPGDLITHVTLAPMPDIRSHYLKIRDRASYEFALASAAIVLKMNGERIEHVRIALGGVGTKPWRSLEAERMLQGKPASEKNFHAAAEAALHGAKPHRDNAFKVELAKRTIVRALKTTSTRA